MPRLCRPRVLTALRHGKVNLDDSRRHPATLLKSRAVVGVKGFSSNPDGSLRSVGITCGLCHSTVDDSTAPGIGRRLDGWGQTAT